MAVSHSIKAVLVGTPLGRLALRLRQRWQLWRTLLRRPEELPALVNDTMAEHLVVRLTQPGSTFLDVGAHVGSVLAEALHHNPTGKAIAVEADPEKAEGLRRRFPTAVVHSCAAGETDGEVAFFVDHARPGYSSLAAGSGKSEVRVPLQRLDSLPLLTTEISVIKIDVEGAELGVLRGAEQLIGRCRPVILFESAPEEVMGYTHEEMWRWLHEHEYAVILPIRLAHDDSGLGLERFLGAHLYPRHTTNYFAVPHEKRIETRDRSRVILGRS